MIFEWFHHSDSTPDWLHWLDYFGVAWTYEGGQLTIDGWTLREGDRVRLYGDALYLERRFNKTQGA